MERLSSSEWDFSDCPPDQLRDCLVWELARESAFFKAGAARLRAKNGLRAHGSENESFVVKGPESTDYSVALTFDAFRMRYALLAGDFFPEQPWLAIPLGRREQFVSSVGDFDVVNPLTHRKAFSAPLEGQRILDAPMGLTEVRAGMQGGWFVINWNYSKASIVAEFKQWLDEHCPPSHKPVVHALGIRVNEKGKGERQVINLLRFLGAARVLSIMPFREAVQYIGGRQKRGMKMSILTGVVAQSKADFDGISRQWRKQKAMLKKGFREFLRGMPAEEVPDCAK